MRKKRMDRLSTASLAAPSAAHLRETSLCMYTVSREIATNATRAAPTADHAALSRPVDDCRWRPKYNSPMSSITVSLTSWFP